MHAGVGVRWSEGSLVAQSVLEPVTGLNRLGRRVRWIAVRGLASALTGLLVLGIGGRLVMLISRLIHPDAVGRLTENGNRVGEFTVQGTIELLIFGGLLSGVVAGVIWVFVREWVPRRPVIVGACSVAIGASGFLIDSGNIDFVILGNVGFDLVLLIGLLFVFGLVLVPIDSWLDHRLPAASGISYGWYAIITALGAPMSFLTFMSMMNREFCFCDHPPIWSGVFLLLTAGATIWWWIADIQGADVPPPWLKATARVLLSLTVVSGATYLIVDLLRII
ncbi:MAG: hypothetical protein HKO03_12980 [Acidimicrobiia bacterium]|nr:hypothetical protein [Acidimicrobiia bacterium]